MRGARPLGVILLVAVAGLLWGMPRERTSSAAPASPAGVRAELFRALRPVPLDNCRLERFGEPHDGGYLLCGNLLEDVEAGYSYGISGYDGWGCAVSTRLDVPVHQYDCFDHTRPVCGSARTQFHAECIADRSFADDAARPFDTLARQLASNGHGRSRVVVKMDVEGAEWASLAQASDTVLARIDQLVMEFHGVDDPRYLEVVRRLDRHFHVAHLHFNNYACRDGIAPFPADAYEVLFVNRRLARRDPAGRARLPHPLDAPNTPDRADCQAIR
jgi:hypothetical protein